jgi:hypothetical protein
MRIVRRAAVALVTAGAVTLLYLFVVSRGSFLP